MRLVRSNKKGTGLVEVIVVLAILSMVIVSVVSVTTRSLVQIKKNEVIDRAVGIQYRSLEFAKSPVQDLGLSTMEIGEVRQFKILSANDTQSLSQTTGTSTLNENSCTASSEYYVDFIAMGYDSLDQSVVCNQVIVELLSNDGSIRTYRIESVLVYTLEGEFINENLIGFRREKIN